MVSLDPPGGFPSEPHASYQVLASVAVTELADAFIISPRFIVTLLAQSTVSI